MKKMLKKNLKNIYDQFCYDVQWNGYKIGNCRIYIHRRQFWNVTLNKIDCYSLGPFKIVRETNES